MIYVHTLILYPGDDYLKALLDENKYISGTVSLTLVIIMHIYNWYYS